MEKKKSGIIMEYIPYIIVIVIAVVIKFFVVTPIRVNGESMMNTLHDGDIMVLNEISYKFSSIKRFDIVVIKHDDEYLIKRVIGLPGEEIEYIDGKLYVDGEEIEETFNHEITADVLKIKVPDNEYYVLGDNRINSTDSRVIGTIPIKNIKGTTSLTIFPFSRFGRKN
ncbi:MAG: signal peptidase I [bacterium]|nr:signal peptidase I [bacterium]